MNIIDRRPIPVAVYDAAGNWLSGNYSTGRRNESIKGIIIHTMVTNMAGADNTFHDPNRGASAHYGVAYDGSFFYQWVADGDTAFHCGRYADDPAHPLANLDTIGIEHDDQGRAFDPRPDALYAASAQLVALKCLQYGIACDRTHIRKHSEVSISPTGCPDTLDIDRIVREAQNILAGITSDPGAVAWGQGRIDVFARLGDNSLGHKWYDGAAWHPWESLGGLIAGAPTVTSWGAGRLDVFARGTDNVLWHRVYDDTTGGWRAWESLP